MNISKGTISIMGFHGFVASYVFYGLIAIGVLNGGTSKFLIAFAVSIIVMLLLYYPTIWMRKYCSFLIEYRK